MRDLLGAGIEALGFEVVLQNERKGFVKEADWHIIIAPHEFFYLGAGRMLYKNECPLNLILINTEQPSTQWFALAERWFSKALFIWDINYQSSHLIRKKGFKCDYLPLGYISNFVHFDEIKNLQDHYGTCFLEPAIRRKSYLHEPFSRRPIDVLFVGYLSPRREEFFAKTASVLSNYHCYFFFWDGSKPVIPGQNTYMNSNTVIGLSQRSKVLLNIHHGKDTYFEWQRIVLHGVWQNTLVVSEPCSVAPPFQPGTDYIEAPLDEIPERIGYYITTDRGQKDAQAIIEHGYQTLTDKCRLIDNLRYRILKLYGLESLGGILQTCDFGNSESDNNQGFKRFRFDNPDIKDNRRDKYNIA
jgi:hypothetical protein